MHHVLIILTLTFIQGQADRNHENNNECDYFRNYSSNACHVGWEDSPTKDLCDHCQSDDFDLHSRSHVRLKLDYFLTCNISDNIEAFTFKLGMAVGL